MFNTYNHIAVVGLNCGASILGEIMKKLLIFVIIFPFVISALCINSSTINLTMNNTTNVKFISYLNISKNNIVIESTEYIGNFNFNNNTAYILISRKFYPNNKKLAGNWFNAEIYVKNNNVEKLILTPPHKPYNLTDYISKKIFNVDKNEFCSFIWNKNPYNLTILIIKNSKLTKIDDNTYRISIPNNISKVLIDNGFGMKKINFNSKVGTIDGVVYINNDSLTAVEFVSKSGNITYKFRLEVVK